MDQDDEEEVDDEDDEEEEDQGDHDPDNLAKAELGAPGLVVT